jgi:hypothetical protein
MSEELRNMLGGIIKGESQLRDYSKIVRDAVEGGAIEACNHYPIMMARCDTLAKVGIFKYEIRDGLKTYTPTEKGFDIGVKLMAEGQKGPSIGFSQMKASDEIVPLDEPKPKKDEIVDLR